MHISTKIGRNAPCICGSGKKFKECCWPLQVERAKWDGLEDRLRGAIQSFFDTERFVDDFTSAMSTYGITVEELDDIAERRLFHDWYVHDYVIPSEGASLISIFLREKGGSLSELERMTVASWAKATMGFFEVLEVKRGVGYRVRDIFETSELFIFDRSSSENLVKYDVLFARPYPIGSIVRLGGGGKLLPHTALNDIKKYVNYSLKRLRKAAGVSDLRDYFRSNSLSITKYVGALERGPPPTVVTPEGDLILFSSSVYSLKEEKAAMKILDASKDFRYVGRDDKDESERYDWVTSAEEPEEAKRPEGSLSFKSFLLTEGGGRSKRPLKVLANLSLKGDRLKIECLSEQRLQACNERVQHLLSGLVKHKADEYKEPDMEEEGEERKGQPATTRDEDRLPPDVEESITKKFFEDYYEKWLNMKIPGLGNLTPMQASKTAAGREKIEALLRDMENMRARAIGQSSTQFPVEKIRAKLRL